MAKRKDTKPDPDKEIDQNGDTDLSDDLAAAQDDGVAPEVEPEDIDAPVDEAVSDDDISTDEASNSEDADSALTDDQAEPTPEAAEVNQISEDEAEILIEEAELMEPSNSADEEAEKAEDADDIATVASEETTPAEVIAPEVIKETVVERQSGFGSTLLGGVVAAVIGYGVAAVVSDDLWPFASNSENPFEEEIRGAVQSQSNALGTLADRVGALETADAPIVDLSGVEGQVSDVAASTSALVERFDALATRIETLEKQPLEQAVSPEAIAAYERALANLQADVEAQRAEVAKMAEEALQAEGSAAEQARLAASRAAMADITGALETGSGFAEALAILGGNGVAVPAALSAVAETGIATQSALMTEFPTAARAALSATRSSETDASEGANRIATFFANQLGARSVSPRDGDDADAVLSRVEAALRSGDLSAALGEMDALPDVAKEALAAWRASAEARHAAKVAADALAQQLIQE